MDCLSVWMDEEGWTEEAARREKGGGGCVLCHRVREGGRKGQAAALCCARGVSGDAVFLYLDLIKELGS